MLVVTVLNLFQTRGLSFPLWFWAPWVTYLIAYIIIDFSFLGLQLTLQYTLPILIGVVAGGLIYSEDDLTWIHKWFVRLIGFVYILFLYANIFGSGFTPAMAAMPMLFSLEASLLTALFFTTGNRKYFFFIAALFIAPVLELTRMGIAAMAVVIIFHFSNPGLRGKILFGLMGALVLFFIFKSKPFQEKTFYSGEGTLSDITIDYYDNENLRSSGRISWKKALAPGLKVKPFWGNGPRADNVYLTKITRMRGGEAHNDYLSVRFNYGYAGLALLLFGFVSSFISLFVLSKKYKENRSIWILSTSALTLYMAFLMFMYTDNILKYTIYFPNYFFAMIGIVYSLKRDEDFRSDTSLQ